MRSLTLCTVLLLAIMATTINAGKVVIGGACVDCNKPEPQGHTHAPTVKPRQGAATNQKSASDEDDWSADGYVLHQTADGQQSILPRHKRQWGGTRQVILTGDEDRGGFSAGGGRVTTIDGRGYRGTVLRNNDCVGCNIGA